MGKTPIEWTDESTNPFVAYLEQPPAGARTRNEGHYCEKVSKGCANCYSSRMQHRFGLPPFQEQRGRADVKHRLKVDRLEYVLRKKKPTKFFWCDMTDMFGAWVPNEWIAACFGVMAATPQHTHQVLTKRAERLPEWFAWVGDQGRELLGQVNETPSGGSPVPAACAISVGSVAGKLSEEVLGLEGWRAAMRAPWPLPNVWLGISAEDQQRADERIPHLLRVPAAVRWVSAEPLLGPINFGPPHRRPGGGSCSFLCEGCAHRISHGLPANGSGLDWVVVGGESGPRARPMDIAWARDILRQCKAAGVSAFTKQMGTNVKWDPDGEDWWKGPHVRKDGAPRFADRKGGDPDEWPEDLRVREFPAGGAR